MYSFLSEQLQAESQKVEMATARLFRLEPRLEEVCSAIEKSLGFDFMAVQLVRAAEKIIETVYGSGRAQGWTGRARHSLLEDKGERDIQTDVFLSHRIEVIAGWDRRFDHWVYTEFNHKDLVRVVAPIFVARDGNGRVVEGDWIENCRWKNRVLRERGENYHNLIVMRQLGSRSQERALRIEAIGTVEAVCVDPRRERGISTDKAIALVKQVAKHAHEIRQTLLTSLLETIAEGAKRLTDMDGAILDLDYDPGSLRYTHSCSSGISQRFLEQNPPRPNGLGRRAIASKEHIIAFGKEHSNPNVFAAGYQVTAVFPVIVDDTEGVLYLHNKQLIFDYKDLIEIVMHYLTRAVDAIRHAMNYKRERDRVRQLESLHSVLKSLVSRRTQKDLLRHISWNVFNVLAASLVIIYEYDESRGDFAIPPDIAGRLKDTEAMQTRVFGSDVPARVVAKDEPLYSTTSSEDHPDLGHPVNRERVRKRFIGREKIESSAGIPLRVGRETVGVMFINYRWRHAFTADEKKIIETLASTAAIAIQNRRLLDEVLEAERQLIATPDLSELMDLIVKGAAQITHSDRAEGYYLDPLDGELVLMAQYPRSGSSLGRRIKIEEGIIGLVATKGEPEGQHRQLCVPLKDNKKRVLGVLLLEKSKAAADDPAFDHHEIRALEVLAQPAVIAMMSAARHKVLSASEKLAALGSFVTARLHWMKRDVGAISMCIRDMKALQGLGPVAGRLIGQVSEKVSAIAEEVQELNLWVIKDPEPVNVGNVLRDARERVRMPENIKALDLVAPRLPCVMGNEQQLIEVFVNLIKNAVEAMPSGGILEVGGNISETGNTTSVVLWVRDSGVGIAEVDFQRIFERGVTNKAEDGLGFGLWWTQTYLQSLGGQISVKCKPCEERKPGETTFTVKLPACAPNEPPTETNERSDHFTTRRLPEGNP